MVSGGGRIENLDGASPARRKCPTVAIVVRFY